MKIFISHSSKNKFYGEKLVDLLRNVGVKKDDIIFTSNTVYGIPVGQNIFEWLKSQITLKPYVIFLLSSEYYKSVACLNEMGAAWIIENKQVSLFTPNFDLKSDEFHNGVIDPRKVGFFINDEDRIFSFVQSLSTDFEISADFVHVNQEVKKFLSAINCYNDGNDNEIPEIQASAIQEKSFENPEKSIVADKQVDLYSKFINLITNLKFKEEELLLLHYVIETGRFKLMTGWQEKHEIAEIEKWEEINEIENQLSRNYPSILNRFELGGFIEVSAFTSYGNPKEFRIKDEISQHLFDLPVNVVSLIKESVYKSHFLFNEKIGLSESLFFEEKDVWDYIYKFADVLIKNFPKNESGIIHSKNIKRIDELFQSLKDCEDDFKNYLWWNNGSSNSDFKLNQKGVGIWHLNNRELNIEEIWIHYDSSSFNDFIIVHFIKGEPFIINGQEQYCTIRVDDKFEITYGEYENKLAEINEEVINLNEYNVEYIERSKEEGFLIICTKFHCALRGVNDEAIREFIEKLKLTSEVVSYDEFQEFQFKIRVHKHSRVEVDL